MEVLIHYKTEVARRGRKIKGLAEGMKMDYSKLSRILNGFSPEPPDFGKHVREVLRLWDRQDRRVEP